VSALAAKIAIRRKHEREVLQGVVAGLQSGAPELLMARLAELDTVVFGWPRAMRSVVRIGYASDEIRQRFVPFWLESGDHIRQETGSDALLAQGLRVLLPRYAGPPLTLYRGDSARNRRRHTYGLS